MTSNFYLILTLALFFLLAQYSNASALESIKQMQGSRKGDKVQNLNELKNYLRHFGYLTNTKFRTNGEAELLFDQEDNKFDHELESAVKTYQLNFNLEVTGILDAETIATMLVPRCGIPDIINDTTRMNSGKNAFNYRFFPRKPKWPGSKPTLSYVFLNNDDGERVRNLNYALAHAFALATGLWEGATSSRFKFNEVTNTNTANIKVGFYNGSHGDGYPFDGRYGTLAHAFAPTDGRLHFDAAEPFTDESPPGKTDIHFQTVAAHELGHILGLDHSSDKDAIMWPYILPGTIKGINKDDVDGINELYG